MSDIASTSSSGQSARQCPQTFVADILGRVDVAIMMCATMRAIPRPNVKRLCLAYGTAGAASLRRWKPAAAFYERLAGACGLVFQKRNKHAPTDIGHRPRKVVVLEYSLHMQVFDGDDLVLVYDPSRQLVKVVFSGARDAFMCARNQLARFISPLGAFLLTGQRLLFALQIPFRLPQMAWVVEFGTVARNGEVRQSDVDPNSLSFRRHVGKRRTVVGQNGGMKLATRVARHGDGFDFADDLAMHDALRPADFRQIDFRSVQLHALRILNGLATMFRLEARIAPAFGKEVIEGAGKILQRLLNSLRVRVLEPFKFLLELRKSRGHGVIIQAFASLTIERLRLGERFVPHPAGATELDSQSLRLLFRRVEPYADCRQHSLDIVRRRLNTIERAPYIPALKGGALRRKR